MDLLQAKAKTNHVKKKRRIGRGEGSGYGKTAGRGMNGAKSRSGWSQRNMTGGNIPLWRRLPKVGFTNAKFKKDYVIFNVGQLSVFDSGEAVDLDKYRDKGMLRGNGRLRVKILGSGELDKPLHVKAHSFSASARDKIENAGGTCDIIPAPKKPLKNKMKQKDVEQVLVVDAQSETEEEGSE